MSVNDDVEHFKNKYRALVQQGHRRYTKPKKISFYDKDTPWDFEYEYGVQIDMSQRDFENLVHMESHFYDTMKRSGPYIGDHARHIVEENEREQRIRSDNPAVKAAYEKYQMLLSMVESHY